MKVGYLNKTRGGVSIKNRIYLIIIMMVLLISGCTSNDMIKDEVLSVNKVDEINKTVVIEEIEIDLENKLSDDIINKLSLEGLAFARNAYYAKHGYIFKNNKYGQYFKSYDWYKPKDEDVKQLLTSEDKENIAKILKIEKVKEALLTRKLYPVSDSAFKWGYIDQKGNLVIDHIYDRADFFEDGLAIVSINDKAGIIRPDGTYEIEPIYHYIPSYKDGLMHVINVIDDKYNHGIINNEGELVYKEIFNNNLGTFNDGYACFTSGNQSGYINTKGEIAFGQEYDDVNDFSEGLAMVTKDFKAGYINTSGELVIDTIYDIFYEDYYTQGFSNGLAAVHINGKYGYIDKEGRIAIEPIYSSANRFSEGLASVCIDDKWGFIDTKGNYVIKPRFGYASSFTGEYAYARPYDYVSEYGYEGFGIINKSGEYITDNNIYYDSNGGGYTFYGEWNNGYKDGLLRVVMKDGDSFKFVYIDTSGKIIWTMKIN